MYCIVPSYGTAGGSNSPFLSAYEQRGTNRRRLYTIISKYEYAYDQEVERRRKTDKNCIKQEVEYSKDCRKGMMYCSYTASFRAFDQKDSSVRIIVLILSLTISSASTRGAK